MALSCVNSVPLSFLPADSPHCRCLVSSCCNSSCSAGQYNSDSAWLNLFALPQVTLPVLTSVQSSWRQLLCWTRPGPPIRPRQGQGWLQPAGGRTRRGGAHGEARANTCAQPGKSDSGSQPGPHPQLPHPHLTGMPGSGLVKTRQLPISALASQPDGTSRGSGTRASDHPTSPATLAGSAQKLLAEASVGCRVACVSPWSPL